MFWQFFLPLPALLVLLSSMAQAETTQLETIEVDATKQIIPFHFGQSDEVEAEELKTLPLPLVSSLLDKSPGIVSTQNGGIGGRSSFFIRGTEARHVAFTLDGLKLNDPSNTDRQFDAAFLGTPYLKELRVHKGPQAVLFGSDAMGGQIEMVTRKGEDHPQTRFSVGGGSFGSFTSSLSSDWAEKENQGTITATTMRSDGISRLNKKRFNATERDGSSSLQILSSSRHKFQQKISTDLLFSFLRGQNELDGATTDNDNDRSQNDQYLAQQKTSYSLSKSLAVSLRNGLNHHQRHIKTLSVGEQAFTGNLVQHEVVLDKKGNEFSYTAGLSQEGEKLHLTGLEKTFEINSVFTQALLKSGKWSWQAGLRGEQHSRYGEFGTGSGGVKYTTGESELAVQYSQGFKAPSLYQLYAPPLFGQNIGNKSLVPETNRSLELGWKMKGEILDSDISIFRNKLSNLITFTNDGYRNQGNFTSQGVEASANLKQEFFNLRSSLTHQQFLDEESTVLRRPYNLAQMTASFFPYDVTEVFVRGRWFSARKDFAQNGDVVKLNTFETVDAGWVETRGNQTFSLQLNNLFNREFEEIYGFSVMPLSVFAGYTVTFR